MVSLIKTVDLEGHCSTDSVGLYWWLHLVLWLGLNPKEYSSTQSTAPTGPPPQYADDAAAQGQAILPQYQPPGHVTSNATVVRATPQQISPSCNDIDRSGNHFVSYCQLVKVSWHTAKLWKYRIYIHWLEWHTEICKMNIEVKEEEWAC